MTPSLTPLVTMLATDMELVNATILARMDSNIPLIPQLAGHLIAAGGKRMRPMMTVAGALLGSRDATIREPAIKLAT
ncbi:MAG: polyprenyl synthetase family protein, partial [Candidatus Puniceispirillaceae bacterium]